MHSGIEIGEYRGVCVCVKAVVPVVCCGVVYLCNCARGFEIRFCFFGTRQQDKSMFYVMPSYQHRMRSHMKLKAKILYDEYNNRELHKEASCMCVFLCV